MIKSKDSKRARTSIAGRRKRHRYGKPRFPDDVLATLQKGMIIGLRAGSKPHRFIALWVVVVQKRVFVRSWSLKQRSWYRTFLEEPRGVVQVGEREIAVRAVQTKSDRLKEAIDRAYLGKYHTPGSVKFARDLVRQKSRDTTTELVPLNKMEV